MFLFCWIPLSLFIGHSFADSIQPLSSEKHISRGDDVTLSCNYSGVVYNLLWYRKHVGSRPEFLILVNENSESSAPSLHLSAKASKDKKQVNLTLSCAEVSDSALYFCALRTGGNKLIFGEGTQVHVEAKQKEDPAYYKLDDSCLATDFTNHSDVKFSGAAPVRYSGKDYQNYYSSFALREENCPETGDCKEGSSGQSRDIERDEKINFISLGLFWLRILFLKTVVFNLLMTFKAWMS